MNVAVIGLGLIGGSVLRALAGAGHRVLGYDADPATRATARTAAAQAPPDGAAGRSPATVRDAVADADSSWSPCRCRRSPACSTSWPAPATPAWSPT